VRSDEVEHAARLAIEVVVLWGGDVLCVSHFAAPAAVFVGSASGCDVALPGELLGAERRCLAVSSGGDVCAVLPGGVRGWLTLPCGSTRPFDGPMPALEREPSERLLPLGLGYRAHLCFANLEIQVATVPLGRPCRRALGIDASALAAFALSTFTVASVMAVLSRLTPTLGLNHDELAESAQRVLLRTYLAASAERLAEPPSEGSREASRASAAKPPPRRPAPGAGAPHAADIEWEAAAAVEPTLGLDATSMPAHDPLERRSQLEEARKFGVVGMLDWPELNDPKLKYERQMNGEELAMIERLFNPEFSPLDEAPGGLALSSIGTGGGGQADVIALGAVRTVDEGQGAGLERLRGATRALEAHASQAPPLRQHESIVSDPLATAVVRRAVVAKREALRGCYRGTSGSVSAMPLGAMVRFVVLSTGQIEQVRVTDPTLPANVNRCIERVFLGLIVPNPVSRPVQVAYRVVLDS
jgi:hypothetical protein